MNEVAENKPSAVTFEAGLLRGEASGYAVCVKPLRFAKLPDAIAMTFAEIGEPNCYYVFESEADAAAALQRMPSSAQLGCELTIRTVRYLGEADRRTGPRLDATGHPFEMRGFIVDKNGATKEWAQSGKLGWRDANLEPETPVISRSGLWDRIKLALHRR